MPVILNAFVAAEAPDERALHVVLLGCVEGLWSWGGVEDDR